MSSKFIDQSVHNYTLRKAAWMFYRGCGLYVLNTLFNMATLIHNPKESIGFRELLKKPQSELLMHGTALSSLMKQDDVLNDDVLVLPKDFFSKNTFD